MAVMPPTASAGQRQRAAQLGADAVPLNKQRGRKVNVDWRADFLHDYQARGGFYKAAEYAGVDSSTVYREYERNPDFKRAAYEARQRFLDGREHNLRRLADNGNVVGDIVLLKAGRPDQYIEKNLSITASFSAELDSQQGAQLLQAMLANLTPESVKALAPQGGVLSAPAVDAQITAPGEAGS